MRPLIRSSLEDAEFSVDLFDIDELNEFGEPLCVAAAILPEQVELFWSFHTRSNAGGERT